MTTRLIAPAGATEYIGQSGTKYIPDAVTRAITCSSDDLLGALRAGFTLPDTGQAAANGLSPKALSFLAFKNADGTNLAASAAAGKFGLTCTPGTALKLVSESANNNTKTDDAVAEIVLPEEYVAGTDLTLTVHASIAGSGTLSTKTLQVKAYKTGNNGAQGTSIGDSAKAITAAGADIVSTIDGATLSPGDRLLIELETVLTETAASGMVASINSARLS